MKKIAFAFILIVAAFCHAAPYFLIADTANKTKRTCVLVKEPLGTSKAMVFRCVNVPAHADTVQISVNKNLTHIEVDTLFADGSRNVMACLGEPLYNRVECLYARIDEVGIKVRNKVVPQTGTIQNIYNGVREYYKLKK
jgi:hypothetical protein